MLLTAAMADGSASAVESLRISQIAVTLTPGSLQWRCSKLPQGAARRLEARQVMVVSPLLTRLVAWTSLIWLSQA